MYSGPLRGYYNPPPPSGSGPDFTAEDIVAIIDNDWDVGAEVICDGSDDEFDFSEDEDMERYMFFL